jgi:hypothetical protein
METMGTIGMGGESSLAPKRWACILDVLGMGVWAGLCGRGLFCNPFDDRM